MYFSKKESVKIAFISLVVSHQLSCTSTQQVPPQPAEVVPAAQSQSQNEDAAAASLGPISKQGEKGPSTSKKQLIQFVTDLSDSSTPFSHEHRQILKDIAPRPQAGSIQEAALAVGIIRTCLDEIENQAGFQEKQIDASGAATPAADVQNVVSISLEERLKEKGVDLAQALQVNLLLKTYRVYGLALKALELTKNSPEYTQNIKGVVATEATQWAVLLKAAEIESRPVETAPLQPEGIGQNNPTVPGPADQALQQAQDSIAPEQSETSIQQAQQLAESGEYKKAVELLKRVLAGSPSQPVASEKLKQISNQAVQVLRQKAAQAFQNALPAKEPQTKIVFLSQAKNYLEQAITDFPSADNLDTVKANLSVISKDLASLQEQQH
jgi:tetratricopeptide (TPR) repeat protein